MKLKSMLDEIEASYLFRLSFLMNNFRDSFLRLIEVKFGLTRPEMTVLFCLGYFDGLNAKDVAELTRQPKNTLSRGTVLLVKKGLITKSEDPRDKRRSVLHLTKTGATIAKRLYPIYEDVESRMIAPLNKKDLADFNRILGKMCEAITDQSENGSQPTRRALPKRQKP